MKIIIPLLFLSLAVSIPAQQIPDRDTRIDWWREARFGMFVTWGLYSGLAGTWNGKPVPSDTNLEHAQRLIHADTYTYAAQAIPKFQPKKDFSCLTCGGGKSKRSS